MSNWLVISWRLLRHELRRGELTVMALAVTLAVTAVLSLSIFSERLQGGLVARSGEFLAADRVLSTRQQVNPAWLEQATEQGLDYAERVTFNSMVFAHEQLALADIKAVTAKYPLRGELEVAEQPFIAGAATAYLPGPGEAWIHSGLFQQLPLALGDVIEVGAKQFTVTKVLTKEPDAGFNVFNDSPTVLIQYADLAATQLIQPGSRVSYNYLFAGEPAAITAYEDWLVPQLDDLNQRWRSIRDDDSPLASALERAERFMLLASLLGVVLAATAVAVAAQRYCQRNYDAVAIMKTLGGTRSFISRVFTAHLLLLSVFSIAAGLALGYGLQFVVVSFVGSQLGYVLPAASQGPWWLAIITGLLAALMFSLYPLLRLMRIPPLRVLRRELDGSDLGRWLHWVFSGATIYVLMVLYSRSWLLSAALFGGGIVATVVLLLIGRLFIRASREAGMQAGSSWRLAMANMQRRARENSLQMLSFSTAIMLFLLVLALRNELLEDWQNQLPENAPNYFVINVAEQQVTALQEVFRTEQIEATDLYPLTPGRLMAVNGELVADAVNKSDREEAGQTELRQGFGRELQLTWRHTVPPENKVVAGSWWPTEASNAQPHKSVSVESRVAKRLNIVVGDVLTMQVGAEEFTVPVSNIREVNWNSMQPNFYLIFSPAAFADIPVTYIASFYLPSERNSELYSLFRDFPQVSLIDVDSIIQQIRAVIGHVSLAITFVMFLVVFAGALVLVAQVQASLEEREQELVILRTLGARSRMLAQAVTYEFIVLGALAGLIAALAMELTIYVLQTQVFAMPATLHVRFWLLGPGIGALVVASLGWLTTRRLLAKRTAALIRNLN
ncbi:ABC transporter permease [Aliidiomarina quisquiliarum]|uniref:ABC transporter permease n=1 Tax=Aliidiomarina quisquiliarum TaxID=2938947 RepID=UPI00208E21F8|nr:FtsX-like permease family protein [Aliidiomarina quisquiliarum]MCO4320149.1 FtsX-like permease family protein [Aliidiomarina quisquiliarum]